MSIRHLDFFFEPRSVAVIGASERPRSVGATVWHNLGAGGYAGALYAVNPKHGKVGTARCWPDVASLPAAPELAVVCTPPAAVPGLIDQLGRAGTKAAIVLSAGLDEAQEQAMLTAARSHLLLSFPEKPPVNGWFRGSTTKPDCSSPTLPVSVASEQRAHRSPSRRPARTSHRNRTAHARAGRSCRCARGLACRTRLTCIAAEVASVGPVLHGTSIEHSVCRSMCCRLGQRSRVTFLHS